MTTEEVQKLKSTMLDAREKFQKFFTAHSRPMTKTETEEYLSKTSELKDAAFFRNFIKLELNNAEDIEEFKRLDEEMTRTFKEFGEGYLKLTLKPNN